MPKPILPFVFLGLLLGCAGDATNTSRPLGVFAPNLAVAGNSGCYTVSGEIAQTGLAPSFSGTIGGDIEGEVSTQLDLASSRAAGQVRFSTAEQTWEVAGGTVPELIGRTVRLTLETEVIFARPPVGRNNTRAMVVDGAEMGILTYHGTLDATPPPPFATHVEYRGVICP
jgi:hypothetical protein